MTRSDSALRSHLIFGGFFTGQERFQDSDAGLDFCDVSVELGHDLPDLVIARS